MALLNNSPYFNPNKNDYYTKKKILGKYITFNTKR